MWQRDTGSGRSRAIVCDVGHTIIHESVLNHVLARLGQTKAARVLYDRNVLNPINEAQMELWVEQIIREKMDAMEGADVEMLRRTASEIRLTPGFDHLLSQARANDVPVMLMGAVPRLFTEALVAPVRGMISNIAGTELHTQGGRLNGVREVCTPQTKARAVMNWLKSQRIETENTVVIGDSIGDLCAMALVPKQNRIAFNTNDPDVLNFADRSYHDEMFNLTRELFG